MNKTLSADQKQAIALLRSPETIRARCNQLYLRAIGGESEYFTVDLSKLNDCCDYVLSLAKQDFLTMAVPFHSRWRHLSLAGSERLSQLNSPEQQYELAIISVLLDAGAGNKWQYHCNQSQQTFNRSEGLAIASVVMFEQTLFSSDKNRQQADQLGLQQLTQNMIAEGMQVSDDNPLEGLAGRTALVKSLAQVIESQADKFGEDKRLGNLYHYVVKHAKNDDGKIDAPKVLAIILETFANIWPGRINIGGENLGDVWSHSTLSGPELTKNLIPFHKLSQWLTYSLLEPLQTQGLEITGLDKLTGLAEYRNGGLLLDFELINLKNPGLATQAHAPESELIIEWRALTICLLDLLWQTALTQLNTSKETFPLVAFLEAGTWKAGRAIAKTKRADGGPPLTIISDGTVF